MPNAFELKARRAKAERLAHELFERNISSEIAAEGGEEGWNKLAELAGVNPPSDMTKADVIALLKERENAKV